MDNGQGQIDTAFELFGIGKDGWEIWFGFVNTLVILVGVVFAIYNLRLMRKQQYFEAFTAFMKELSETEDKRSQVYNDFSLIDDYRRLTKDEEKSALEVINFLNRTATLVESKMLPKFPVLSLVHTSIIRCWWVLESYAAWREAKYGGRYGRRVARLDMMAKRFHDSRSHQRVHPIHLFRITDESPIEIYRTYVPDGFRRYASWVKWKIIDFLKRY